MFGVPHIVLEYGLLAFVVPVAVFMVVYMIFGFLVSRKVKKVSTRELITE
jgi:ABC-type antimicrobial peptide transport system permease subunit